MKPDSILVSIHPRHVEKILTGEKRVEFRRRWTRRQIDSLVIYATAPVQKIVAVVTIKEVTRGSKQLLWNLAQSKGGGLEKVELYDYLQGLDEGVAIEITDVSKLPNGGIPLSTLSVTLRPPQSFCFLNHELLRKIFFYLE